MSNRMNQVKGLEWVEVSNNGIMAGAYKLNPAKITTREHVECDGTFWYWDEKELKRAKYGSASTDAGYDVQILLDNASRA